MNLFEMLFKRPEERSYERENEIIQYIFNMVATPDADDKECREIFEQLQKPPIKYNIALLEQVKILFREKKFEEIEKFHEKFQMLK